MNVSLVKEQSEEQQKQEREGEYFVQQILLKMMITMTLK